MPTLLLLILRIEFKAPSMIIRPPKADLLTVLLTPLMPRHACIKGPSRS